MFNPDETKAHEMAMVEIAYEILKQTKGNYSFETLAKEVARIKGMTEEEMTENLAQFYTEINIDGRFIHLGQNEWGLKNWYPDQQIDAVPFSRDDEEEEEDDYDEDEDLDFDEEEEEEEEEDDEDEDEELYDEEDEEEEVEFEEGFDEDEEL